jgi:FkbM family methyltransferase
MRVKQLIERILYCFSSQRLSPIISLLFKKIRKEKDITVVDIGSHRGKFIDEISSQRKVKKAILVEPILSNYEILKEKYKNSYKLYNCAVYNIDGTVNFNINEYDETSSVLDFNKIKEIDNINKNKVVVKSVTAKKLDTIVSENNLAHIDLLKIDVQGAEMYVLEGALETLPKTKFLIIELSLIQVYNESATFQTIHHTLKKFGFILVELDPIYKSEKGEILQLDGLYVNENFL